MKYLLYLCNAKERLAAQASAAQPDNVSIHLTLAHFQLSKRRALALLEAQVAAGRLVRTGFRATTRYRQPA